MTFLIVLPSRNGCSLLRSLGGGFDGGVVGVGRDLDHVAQLAVHLHGNFERVFDQQRRIELRPGRVSELRRSRVESRESRAFATVPRRDAARRAASRIRKSRSTETGFDFPGHRFVDENHHGRDGGVEAHAVEVFGDFLDAGVQRLQLRRRCRRVLIAGLSLMRFRVRAALVSAEVRGFVSRGGSSAVVSACSNSVSLCSSTNSRQTRPRKR